MRCLLLLLALPALTSCGPSNGADASSRRQPIVYTTFYPTSYFATRIGGPAVRVVCPVPEDADPIFWMPDESTIQAYQGADLVVINGAAYEKWVIHVSLPEATLVDTARPFEDDLITYPQAITHSHGPAGRHSHEGIDGHTWMDPALAKRQAEQILNRLIRLLPDEAGAFRGRFALLAAGLDRLSDGLRAASKQLGDQTLLASHPAYDYIARSFGWKVVNFALDPTTPPSAEQIADLRETAARTGASILLWEREPIEEMKRRAREEAGLESVVFATCEVLSVEQRQSGLDYLTIMRHDIEALGKALASHHKPARPSDSVPDREHE